MVSLICTLLLLGSLLFSSTVAIPIDISATSNEVSLLTERAVPIKLGNYSVSTSLEDVVLFKKTWGSTSSTSLGTGITSTISGGATLIVECVDCRTWGNIVITTSGVTKNSTSINDVIQFFEHPIETIIEAFNADLRIDFDNVGGHFELAIITNETATYELALYMSETVTGYAAGESVSLGLVLFLDLVFSVSAEIDLSVGFEVHIPKGSYLTVDPLTGKVVAHDFTGGVVEQLPAVVISGSATFDAALRVRVQVGTTIELFGVGFDIEMAAYADLIEYRASITSTQACEVLITESVDIAIGAYAHAVVEIDYTTFGVSPTAVTTIYDLALPSYCLTHTSSSATSIVTSTASIAARDANIAFTTSAVYATNKLTAIECASALLHCPPDLASEVVVTNTEVLYTTVFPVGEMQLAVAPATTSAAVVINTPQVLESPISLTPLATPVISTIFAPTFADITWAMPSAYATAI